MPHTTVRVGKGGRGVAMWYGACSAVPTMGAVVGTAEHTLRLHQTVRAAFCPPYTSYRTLAE
jgi:hypothetical protein